MRARNLLLLLSPPHFRPPEPIDLISSPSRHHRSCSDLPSPLSFVPGERSSCRRPRFRSTMESRLQLNFRRNQSRAGCLHLLTPLATPPATVFLNSGRGQMQIAGAISGHPNRKIHFFDANCLTR
ncbi:hypothetical protein JCGZ_09114 [Jatropha curcas]|uniref:Uncharacterized protein n=1 Tax=Jatropha curcas TaxID=180498 RepID=A0A067KHH1_JATCU|nr:hypothetical protein JCGZ_09114 [Jatropha curcas]